MTITTLFLTLTQLPRGADFSPRETFAEIRGNSRKICRESKVGSYATWVIRGRPRNNPPAIRGVYAPCSGASYTDSACDPFASGCGCIRLDRSGGLTNDRLPSQV